ncbi:multiple epidermal growth factor-like domains protein 10 [Mya arenaria]|uniref:multiple epidermal growth factor-like domains protein 10 n=1 Tax=Mya arenaria TaxID=6604 RepID=UPI0022E5D436|nr:multiple epidermal growth factor-like domains protein 10 [Mya arenaria]
MLQRISVMLGLIMFICAEQFACVCEIYENCFHTCNETGNNIADVCHMPSLKSCIYNKCYLKEGRCLVGHLGGTCYESTCWFDSKGNCVSCNNKGNPKSLCLSEITSQDNSYNYKNVGLQRNQLTGQTRMCSKNCANVNSTEKSLPSTCEIDKLADCFLCPKLCKEEKCKIIINTRYLCTEGCAEGWSGIYCDDKCLNGNCLSCSQENPFQCVTCKLGYYMYKPGICKRCSLLCPDDQCNNVTGRCIYKCKRGIFGEYCNTTCNSNCLTRSDNSICDPVNGSCVEGCNHGYFGSSCNKDCSEFVRFCRKCTAILDETVFEKCLECNVGLFYNETLNACIPCPSTCSGTECANDESGRCLKGCTRGYFGRQCLQICSEKVANCTECKSNKTHWFCSECKSGTYLNGNGSECIPCPSNCRLGQCNRNGLCYCCEDGYNGVWCSDIDHSSIGMVAMGAVLGFIVIISLSVVGYLLRRRMSVPVQMPSFSTQNSHVYYDIHEENETSFMQTDVISNGVYSYAYNREHFHDDDFGEIVGQYYLTLISDGTSSTQTDLEHL